MLNPMGFIPLIIKSQTIRIFNFDAEVSGDTLVRAGILDLFMLICAVIF